MTCAHRLLYGVEPALEHLERIEQEDQRGPSGLGESVVVEMSSETADVPDALRCTGAELRQQSAQRIDRLSALSDQQLARPVHDQNGLLLFRLDRHEPHRRPRHRLAGGGYYDRTLARLDPLPRVIGVGFAGCRIPTIYPMPWDIPMHDVVLADGTVQHRA